MKQFSSRASSGADNNGIAGDEMLGDEKSSKELLEHFWSLCKEVGCYEMSGLLCSLQGHTKSKPLGRGCSLPK